MLLALQWRQPRDSELNGEYIRAEVDLAGGVLLKSEDLLLLEGRSIGIDAVAEGLNGQVVTGRVDEAEAPSEGINTSGRHFQSVRQ